MTIITVTSKGQLAIPVKYRKKLNIGKGTRCIIEERDGELVLVPITADYLDKAAGILPTRGKLGKLLIKERIREKQKEA